MIRSLSQSQNITSTKESGGVSPGAIIGVVIGVTLVLATYYCRGCVATCKQTTLSRWRKSIRTRGNTLLPSKKYTQMVASHTITSHGIAHNNFCRLNKNTNRSKPVEDYL